MEAVRLHLVELSAPLTPRGGAAAGDVFGMIQVFICGAQEAYEEFVKDTNAPVDAKSKEAVNKYEEKDKGEGALVGTQSIRRPSCWTLGSSRTITPHLT